MPSGSLHDEKGNEFWETASSLFSGFGHPDFDAN